MRRHHVYRSRRRHYHRRHSSGWLWIFVFALALILSMSFFGSVISGILPTPTPTPYPTATPTPTPGGGGGGGGGGGPTPTPVAPTPTPYTPSTSLNGFWGSYLWQFDGDYSPEIWLDYSSNGGGYWLDRAQAYKNIGFTTVRLMFDFVDDGSGYCVLDYAKFNRVLEIFNSVGLKVIADFHTDNYHQPDDPYIIPYWQAFTAQFCQNGVSDTRIAAFQIFNEPGNWPHITSSGTRVINFYASLARAIWTIDPNRKVMFPMCQFLGWSNAGNQYSGVIKAIKDTLIDTGDGNPGRILFDCCHPYYSDGGGGIKLGDTVAVTLEKWINPYVTAFGASRCWIGETYLETTGQGSLNPDLARAWYVDLINACAGLGVGIQPMTLYGYRNGTALEDAAMAQTVWESKIL